MTRRKAAFSNDGARFVVIRRELGAADRVRVVLNWASKLEERLAGTGSSAR